MMMTNMMEAEAQPAAERPPQTSERAPQKVVYSVLDKPGMTRSHWVKIGVAWVNRDGSLKIKLDALPINNELVVRDAEEWRNQRRNGGGRDELREPPFDAYGASPGAP